MLSLLSKRVTTRVLVRAFTTTTSTCASKLAPAPGTNSLAQASQNNRYTDRRLFTATAVVSQADLEEDLDEALDSILGGPFTGEDDLDLKECSAVSTSVPEEVSFQFFVQEKKHVCY